MQHPQHPTLNPAPWLGRAQCPHPGGPTGHGWLTGESTHGSPTLLPTGHLPNPACTKGRGRAGAPCGTDPAEPEPVPRAGDDAGAGPRGPAWGGRRGGHGAACPAGLPHALTHGRTLSVAASPPRACPLLHLEPCQECGRLTRPGGTVPARSHGHPSARPPRHCLGGARGCCQRGMGVGRVAGGPTAPLAQRGARDDAETGARACSHMAPLPSTCPAPLPGLAPTEAAEAGGRRKRIPTGGLCRRNPRPRAGWGQEEMLPPGLVPAPACATPRAPPPQTGTRTLAHARVCSLCTQTPAHTLTPLHARPGGCCTPTHALPRPGQMLPHVVHTHPVMGARTPSLPGRAALSPPAAVPVYGDGAACPALPAPARAGQGRGHRHESRHVAPDVGCRCCRLTPCLTPGPGAARDGGVGSLPTAAWGHPLPHGCGATAYSGNSSRKSWRGEPDPVCYQHRHCHGDVLQQPGGGEAAVRGGAGAPDPCPVLLGAWASGCPSTPGQGWLSPSLLPDPPRLLRDAGRSGAALRPFPSWGDGGRCCAQGRGERVRSEEQPEESSPGPDPLCCIPQCRDTLQGDRLSSSPACYLWGN